MNRQKSATHISGMVFSAPIIAAIIVAGGGILHAVYKNRQIQANRDIDAIERRIEQYKLDIRTTQMRSDILLNRFAIRKQLEDSGSDLRPIPLGLPEAINSKPPTAVAATMP
jgi:hypothetical protein